MKMLVIILALIVCLGAVSCSKDDINKLPADGQYVSEALDLVVSMQLSAGDCTLLTIYIKGEYFNRWNFITKTGKYPMYKYSFSDFDIQTTFNSSNSFSAILSGVLSSENGNSQTTIDGTAPIFFQLDNRVLDTDADGILDSMQ